jgi:hypothetical protein
MIGINLVRSPKWLDSSDTGQDLTFEEICPIWSDKLRKGLELQDKYVLAFDSKYCLVGEAWGFTGKQAGYYIAPLMPCPRLLDLRRIRSEIWYGGKEQRM